MYTKLGVIKKTVAWTVNDPFCIIYWHTKRWSNEKNEEDDDDDDDDDWQIYLNIVKYCLDLSAKK